MASKTRQSLAQPDLQFGNEPIPASMREKLDRLTQSVRAVVAELQKVQQAMAGGSTGQVLEKTGGGDYEAAWEDAPGGTVTGAANLGAGAGLFKSLDAGVLGFKTLIAGTNITFSVAAETITIVATGGGEGAGTVTSVGINSADLQVTGSPVTVSGSIELEILPQAVTYPKMQLTAADAVILGRGFGEGAGQLEEQTLSQVLDFLGSAQQGDILFRGVDFWQYLTPDVPGKFLQTQGTAADPVWTPVGTATTLLDPLILGLDYGVASATGWADVTIACLLRAPLLTNLATSWNFGLNVTLGPMLVTSCVVRRVARDTNTYVDSTPVTFGASLTPTLATGLNVSDEIALPVDEAHDYVILLHFDAAVSGSASLPISAGDGSDLASTSAAGDHTADANYSAFSFSVDSNVSFYGAWVVRGNIGSVTAVWREGGGVPSNSLGVDGDFYLDGTTGDVYERISGAYVLQCNILGPAGPASPSPLTTKGDIYGYSTLADRIPVGADTTVLTADSSQALGVKWAAGGSALLYGQPDFAVPPTASWTWLAQGSATVASIYAAAALRFFAPFASGADALYVRTVTPGTFTVTLCLMVSGFNIQNNSRVGIYWRDSGTGHMQMFVIDMRASPVPFASYNFSNLTTFNATIFSGASPPGSAARQLVSIPIWLRVVRDGSNHILCYTSDDGVSFVQVSTTDATNYVASPDQVGIGWSNTATSGAQNAMNIILYSFAVGP